MVGKRQFERALESQLDKVHISSTRAIVDGYLVATGSLDLISKDGC